MAVEVQRHTILTLFVLIILTQSKAVQLTFFQVKSVASMSKIAVVMYPIDSPQLMPLSALDEAQVPCFNNR